MTIGNNIGSSDSQTRDNIVRDGVQDNDHRRRPTYTKRNILVNTNIWLYMTFKISQSKARMVVGTENQGTYTDLRSR